MPWPCLLPPSSCLVSHRLWEVCGEVVLHHVEGGGGRLVASDGRDRVRPGRDDDRLVVVLHGKKGRFEVAWNLVTILDGKNLQLTLFWHFWQLLGRYCSYLLPRHDGWTSQISVNGRFLPTRIVTQYISFETEYILFTPVTCPGPGRSRRRGGSAGRGPSSRTPCLLHWNLNFVGKLDTYQMIKVEELLLTCRTAAPPRVGARRTWAPCRRSSSSRGQSSGRGRTSLPGSPGAAWKK